MPLQMLTTRATPKATKQAARYTPAGGAERCGMCRHYVPTSSCARIEGPVSAAGWCQLYSRQVTYAHHAGVQSFGGAPPSLDLSFLTPGTLDPRITFTRASTATYFDGTGTLQTATTNAPRWDYDPVTHALRGLLIEEARTNVLLNSATLGTQSVTVTAQAYTLSFYGTGTITKSGTATGALVGTGAFPARVSQTFTPTAGTLTLTVTGTVSNAQLEAGAFVTSYVSTAGASATRAVELATAPTAAWYNSSEGSLVADVIPQVNGGGNQDMPCLSTDANNLFNFRFIGNLAQAAPFTSGSAAAAATTSNQVTFGIRQSLGFTYAAGTLVTVALAGGPVGSAVGSSFPTVNQLLIGRIRTTNPNCWVRRVRYWPRALGASELQSVTT